MKNYKLTLEYDGTNYHGFQIQPDLVTIQGMVENALTKLAKEPVKVIGAGRTDAGVHALNQVLNFCSNLTVPVEKLGLAVNSILPKDIRVKEALEVDQNFHARFNAIEKTYLYRIEQGNIGSVFSRNYCWWIKKDLAWDKIISSSKILIGKHDFAGFAASGSEVYTTVRTLKNIEVKSNAMVTELRFTGDGFLYNMVRNIVGTLVEIGYGKRDPDSLKEILASRNRCKAGATAPPQGLFLESVIYD